jgi:hypothetical protein
MSPVGVRGGINKEADMKPILVKVKERILWDYPFDYLDFPPFRLWIVPGKSSKIVNYSFIAGDIYIDFPILNAKVKKAKNNRYLICPENGWNIFYHASDCDFKVVFPPDAEVLESWCKHTKRAIISAQSPYVILECNIDFDNPRMFETSILSTYDNVGPITITSKHSFDELFLIIFQDIRAMMREKQGG